MKSVIWQLPIDELRTLIANSPTFSAVLAHFKLVPVGGNVKTLKRRLVAEGISFDHIQNNKGRFTRAALKAITRPLEEIMVEDSPCTSQTGFKRRLLRAGVLENKCQICGQLPEWQGKPLTLRLDHKNGKRKDNRPENLRLVCPNCDSQLPTYGSKNWKFQKELASQGSNLD